jgi:hypothetical protein
VSVLRTIGNGSQEKIIAEREDDGFGDRASTQKSEFDGHKHLGEIRVEREIEVSSAEVKQEVHRHGW